MPNLWTLSAVCNCSSKTVSSARVDSKYTARPRLNGLRHYWDVPSLDLLDAIKFVTHGVQARFRVPSIWSCDGEQFWQTPLPQSPQRCLGFMLCFPSLVPQTSQVLRSSSHASSSRAPATELGCDQLLAEEGRVEQDSHFSCLSRTSFWIGAMAFSTYATASSTLLHAPGAAAGACSALGPPHRGPGPLSPMDRRRAPTETRASRTLVTSTSARSLISRASCTRCLSLSFSSCSKCSTGRTVRCRKATEASMSTDSGGATACSAARAWRR
mmetsp:Transcript_21626/g.60719  ORF Transcript_21626/g.60719 Transcript_21626/m.60719 type:complete len:270 (+) Transcript_21626:80-889(+)